MSQNLRTGPPLTKLCGVEYLGYCLSCLKRSVAAHIYTSRPLPITYYSNQFLFIFFLFQLSRSSHKYYKFNFIDIWSKCILHVINNNNNNNNFLLHLQTTRTVAPRSFHIFAFNVITDQYNFTKATCTYKIFIAYPIDIMF